MKHRRLVERLAKRSADNGRATRPGWRVKVTERLRALHSIQTRVAQLPGKSLDERREAISESLLDYWMAGGSSGNIMRVLQGRTMVVESIKDYADSKVGALAESKMGHYLVDAELDLRHRDLLLFFSEGIQGKVKDIAKLLGERCQVLVTEGGPEGSKFLLKVKYESLQLAPDITERCPSCNLEMDIKLFEGRRSFYCPDCSSVLREGVKRATVLNADEIETIQTNLEEADVDRLSGASINQIAESLQKRHSIRQISAKYGVSHGAVKTVAKMIPESMTESNHASMCECIACGGVMLREMNGENMSWKCQSCAFESADMPSNYDGMPDADDEGDDAYANTTAYESDQGECPSCAVEMQVDTESNSIYCGMCAYERKLTNEEIKSVKEGIPTLGSANPSAEHPEDTSMSPDMGCPEGQAYDPILRKCVPAPSLGKVPTDMGVPM